MALAADMIFVGTVDSLRQSGTAETPWTTVTFAVEEWLALEGQAIDREDPPDDPPLTVELDFLGGGGLTVSGLPQFRERDRLLLFAYDDAGLASPIVGVSQGVWTLDARGAQDAAGAYLRVPAPGRLLTDSVGSGVEELLVAISELLADGTLPGPLEPERSEESPEEAADGAADEAAEEAAEDAAEETAEDAAEDPTEPAEPVDDPEAAQDPEGAPDPADDPAPGEAPPQQVQGTTPTLVPYSVDESGGPLLLSSTVESAAQAWSAAAPESVRFERTDGSGAEGAATEEGAEATAAVHRIAYGDVELFGPDALSFTLLRPGAAATEVLVSPTSGEMLTPVLLHELGVLAGLPEGGQGVMASAVPPGVTAPTPVDVTALRESQVFTAEDINRDGVVDFYDLAELAQAFGGRGVNLAADLNGDGVVDEADLEALRSVYQFSPPAERAPD